MKVFILGISILLITAQSFSHATKPSPPTTPAVTPSTSTSAIPEANPVATPAPVTLKNSTFTVRVQANACVSGRRICSIDTFIVAYATDNGELQWERRIYSQTEPTSPAGAMVSAADPLIAIPVTRLKLIGKKIVQAKNARGDVFDLDIKMGHLEKPKEPRVYADGK